MRPFLITVTDDAGFEIFRACGVRSDRIAHVMHTFWMSTSQVSGRFIVEVRSERVP